MLEGGIEPFEHFGRGLKQRLRFTILDFVDVPAQVLN
jgi:hypothetical protein